MPLVPFPQFVGGDYTAQSVNTAASELVNWYVEQTQSPADQSPFPTRLQPTPGLTVFTSGLEAPIRAIFSQDGRLFVVGGPRLYELFGDGHALDRGPMVTDDQPATITSNGHRGHQLFITSAGVGYIFDLVSNTLFQLGVTFPSHVIMGDYIDGFFVVLQASTSQFFINVKTFDGLNWDQGPGQLGEVSSFSDSLIAFRVQARNLWNFGSQHTEVWTIQPDEDKFPLAPIQPLIECGIAAPWSIAECFGTLCFVVRTKLGTAAVMQTEGYSVKPISTPNESRILSALPDLANVRAYSYQDQGHIYYVLCPNTGPALVYDLVTQLWHRRGVWNAGLDAYQPLRQWCHAYAFDKHLVGDRTLGAVYEQSARLSTDFDIPVRRVRTCPHVNEQQQWLFGSQVSIGVETGLSPGVTTPEGVFVPATIRLSYSKDGGHTFSEPRTASLGRQGEYGRLVTWYQTPGRFHDLVLRAETDSTFPVRLNSCQLRIDAGTGQR